MTTADPIFSGLNHQQFEAVTAPDVPVLIVAGAGSGKTRVITRRIAFLIRERGYHPWQIFAATFTNKAADEMKRRVVQLLPHVPKKDLAIATFHSLCARILRYEIEHLGWPSNFTIADEHDQLSAIKHVMKELGISDKEIKPQFTQQIINQCKIRMLEPEDVGEIIKSRYEEQLAEIFRAYRDYLRRSSALDFEDLILVTVQLFTECPEVLSRYQERFRHVMVDEFQDINDSQFALVRLLTGAHHRVTVVGDEDQTIYTWRGANIRHILDFEKYYPERLLVHLEQNYRSTANILTAAGGVISHNQERFHKTLFTEAAPGAPVIRLSAESDREEAEGVAKLILQLSQRCRLRFSDIAIFYRTGALSRIYEENLRAYDIPYRVVGGVRFYDRMEIKDMLAYLQVAHNPDNTLALLRIINVPKRGLGEKTLETLLSEARRSGSSLVAVMERARQIPELKPAARETVLALAEQIREWHRASKSEPPSKVFLRIREEVGYDEYLGNPDELEVRSRIENLDELLSSLVAYESEHYEPTLEGFLENVSLLSPTDELSKDQDAVTLMTLHMAKGLEYPCVFVVGCNEELLPHARSIDEDRLEEERRLFYVGMTRARQILVLSYSYWRVHYGQTMYQGPSPFLGEIPGHVVQRVDAAACDFARLAHEIARSQSRRKSKKAVADTAQEEAPSKAPPRQSLSAGGDSLMGKRVRHPLVGEGVIVDMGGQGRSKWYLVETDEGTRVKLMARYAKFEVLE